VAGWNVLKISPALVSFLSLLCGADLLNGCFLLFFSSLGLRQIYHLCLFFWDVEVQFTSLF